MQERSAVLEDGDDLCEPEHVHARGGELNRERQAIHTPGDLRGEGRSLGVRLESRPRRARTLEKEVNGCRPERYDRQPYFACDAERLAACRHDPEARTVCEERRDDPR